MGKELAFAPRFFILKNSIQSKYAKKVFGKIEV
jgi:hypothetical protein